MTIVAHDMRNNASIKSNCKTGDVTASLQIAKRLYQQIEKANGQVWVMEKVLRHLDPEWAKCFAA